MKLILFASLFFLLLPTVVFAQKSSDVCRVTSSTWSQPEKRGTGIYELGRFPVTDFDEQTVKSFRFNLYDSDLIVNVGVEYGDAPAVEKGKPTDIRIALVVSSKEQDPFDFLGNAGSAIAGTKYSRRWGSLFVEKPVVVGQLIHTFTLACNDGTRARKR